MQDSPTSNRPAKHTAPSDDPHHTLRALGGQAHQIRAAFRAADHFNTQASGDANNTGSWLISSAVELAQDVTADIDSLARSLKERSADAGLQQRVAALRVRAHQLCAAARAADHFLDQDTSEDRETGSWLVATAMALANKLSSELDDSATPTRRAPVDKAAQEPQDATTTRRMASTAGR
jgi:hypothetical protein